MNKAYKFTFPAKAYTARIEKHTSFFDSVNVIADIGQHPVKPKVVAVPNTGLITHSI